MTSLPSSTWDQDRVSSIRQQLVELHAEFDGGTLEAVNGQYGKMILQLADRAYRDTPGDDAAIERKIIDVWKYYLWDKEDDYVVQNHHHPSLLVRRSAKYWGMS